MSRSLATLRPGEAATIIGYSSTDDTKTDELSQRLMHMGLVEGTAVTVVRHAPSGDPIEIQVMGYALSLRRSEATLVLVNSE